MAKKPTKKTPLTENVKPETHPLKGRGMGFSVELAIRKGGGVFLKQIW